YSYTPTAAGAGEIDAACTGLPNLADPVTVTDPAVALKLTPQQIRWSNKLGHLIDRDGNQISAADAATASNV
ncbi:MAG: hypothetical protein ACREMY_18945, partial [bacterium]